LDAKVLECRFDDPLSARGKSASHDFELAPPHSDLHRRIEAAHNGIGPFSQAINDYRWSYGLNYEFG
jgi:hypothetical protein